MVCATLVSRSSIRPQRKRARATGAYHQFAFFQFLLFTSSLSSCVSLTLWAQAHRQQAHSLCVCVRYSCCAPHGWTVCTVWWWNTCTENRPYIVHICLLLLVDASAKSADSFRFVRAHNSFSPYFSRAPWTTRCRMNLSVYESMSVWSWRDS